MVQSLNVKRGNLLILFVYITFTLAHFDSNPHFHNRSSRSIEVLPSKYLSDFGEDRPQITFSPTTIEGNNDTVTVYWKGINFSQKTDWIGVYAGYEGKRLPWGAPVYFRNICQSVNCTHGAPGEGSMTFDLLNRREPYQFVYFSGRSPYFEAQAISKSLEFVNYDIPMHVHIATGPGSTMYVMWVQRTYEEPAAYFGKYKDNLESIAEGSFIRKINITDFCDREGPAAPAANEGFFDLGYMFTATLDVEYGQTYFYRVGEPKNGYSEVFQFTSTKAPAEATTLIAFGDMGQSPGQGIQEQSWDNMNHGELGSIDTVSSIASLLNDEDTMFDYLLHFGDISYATGYLCEWDQFMHQIIPIARNIPYMVGIGNHEYGYTGSLNAIPDSGGECGVPYNFYFPFASQNLTSTFDEKKPWYSFNYGNTHVIQMSSEHEFEEGSEQYNFIEDDLSSVDRKDTPWVILTSHRPLYVDSSWSGDHNMSDWLAGAIEPLMVKYNVNLGLYGHYHAYQRSCPVVEGTCAEDGEAPVHMVLGMAGYELTTLDPEEPAEWALHRDQKNFGYSRLTFPNATTGIVEFLSSTVPTTVLDTLILDNYS